MPNEPGSATGRLADLQLDDLYKLAVTDSLTGCYNRRFFDEIVDRELATQRRYGVPLSLLFIDVDHFKAVNDESLADDVKMETAYRFWEAKEYKKLRDHLADFPKKSNRYTEARYHEGLAKYHLDEEKDSLEVWRCTITACAQDRVI